MKEKQISGENGIARIAGDSHFHFLFYRVLLYRPFALLLVPARKRSDGEFSFRLFFSLMIPSDDSVIQGVIENASARQQITFSGG